MGSQRQPTHQFGANVQIVVPSGRASVIGSSYLRSARASGLQVQAFILFPYGWKWVAGSSIYFISLWLEVSSVFRHLFYFPMVGNKFRVQAFISFPYGWK